MVAGSRLQPQYRTYLQLIAMLGAYLFALVSGVSHYRSPHGPDAVGWYYSGEHVYPFGNAVAENKVPAGSRLLQLNGFPVAGYAYNEIYAHLQTDVGDVNHLRVVRPDGQQVDVSIPVAAPSWMAFFDRYQTRLLLGLALVCIGGATYVSRVHSTASWALLSISVIAAVNLFLNALIFYPRVTVAYVYEAFASGCIAAISLHLGLVFPVVHPLLVHRRRFLGQVYGVGALLGAAALYLRIEGRTSKWMVIAPAAAIGLGYMIIRALVLTRRVEDLLTRQRARILTAGYIVGLAPTVGAVLLQKVFGFASLNVEHVLWTMFAFPTVLTYLTVRHEPVNVRIAVRRAVAYVGSFISATLLGWGIAGGLTWLVLGAPQPLVWWTVLVGFGMVGSVHVALWPRVSVYLDRWFYPQRGTYPTILQRAEQNIAAASGPLAVLDQLITAARDLSGATSATAFVMAPHPRGGHYLRSNAPLGPIDVAVLLQTALVQRMARTRRHLRRDQLPVDPEYRDMMQLGLAVFGRLHADVLLPLIVEGDVVGGLAIGPRVSGDVYESFEIDAIQALTDQAAAALPRKLAASA